MLFISLYSLKNKLSNECYRMSSFFSVCFFLVLMKSISGIDFTILIQFTPLNTFFVAEHFEQKNFDKDVPSSKTFVRPQQPLAFYHKILTP